MRFFKTLISLVLVIAFVVAFVVAFFTILRYIFPIINQGREYILQFLQPLIYLRLLLSF